MTLARFVRKRRAIPVRTEEGADSSSQLAVGRRFALGELLNVAEIQAWIGEWQARHRLVEFKRECETIVVPRFDFHTQSAKCFQVAIEPADIDP